LSRAFSVLCHVLHGLVAGASWFISPFLSVFLFLQFFLYEWVEETKIKDEMFYELREWAFGFIIGMFIGVFVL